MRLYKARDRDGLTQALRRGAHGYLLKDMEPEDLCEHLKKAANGASVLSESVTGSLINALATNQRMPAAQADLTAREAARLAAILPSPRRYKAASPGPYVRRRASRIQAAMGTVREAGLDRCVDR